MRSTDAIKETTAALKGISDAKGVSLSAFSTAWVLNQPGITSPIIGPRTLEQYEDYMKALDITITDEEQAEIDAIVTPGEHVTAYYQKEFSDFKPQQYRW